VKWKVVYTKQAQKDAKKIARSGLKSKALELIEILGENPFQNPPPYEKLVGDLLGCYSRRINIQHRLVYQVLEKDHVVKVIRLWTRYE
jgi:toxin YoeB